MANDLNRYECIGRLGRDPESRFLPSGDEVVNMSIAVGKSWRDRESGEKKESLTWVPVVVFGGLAGVCSRYLAKGSRVYIAGELRIRKWTDQSGQDRFTTEIIASNMQMLDSRQGDGQQGGFQQQGQRGSAANPNQGGQQPPQGGGGFDAFDDDIPFNIHERGILV